MSEPLTLEVVDDRQGKPSASSMKRTRRCPGWLNLAATLPKQEGGKDADAGTSRHNLIELEVDAETLADNEAYVVAQSNRLREEAIAKTFGSPLGLEVYKEQRLWLYDDSLEPVCSAKLDWLGIKDSLGLVVDYKTLFGNHSHAAENEQLATQAVLAAEVHSLNEVAVALIQPNLPTEKQLTMARFDRNDLLWAKVNVLRWSNDAMSPYAPRIPGPVQCENCPCRAYCPEAIAAELAVTIASPAELTAPEAIAVLLDRAELADRVVKAIREKAKRMIEAKVAIPGWTVEEGDTQRKITKPTVLAGVLAEAGATPAQIEAIAKIGITDADKLYYQLRKASPDKLTQAKAREELQNKLTAANAMESTKKQGSLIRIK